jgi:hypothetical protein
MTHNLQDLADNRDALLLGEVAAFLHDWQKCIGYWKKLGATFNPSDISSVLNGLQTPDPLKLSLQIPSIKQLIEEGKDPSNAKHSLDWRIRLLGNCHDVAHIDKPAEQGLGNITGLIASVFGFEIQPEEKSSEPGFLTKKIKKWVKNCENVYVESISAVIKYDPTNNR